MESRLYVATSSHIIPLVPPTPAKISHNRVSNYYFCTNVVVELQPEVEKDLILSDRQNSFIIVTCLAFHITSYNKTYLYIAQPFRANKSL